MKISRRVALLTLGLPALHACSEPVDFTPEEFRSAAPSSDGIPPAETVDVAFFARSTAGRHITVPGASSAEIIVSSPHFDGRIGEIFVGETIPHDIAQSLDHTSPLQAPEGHRFVAFTAQAGKPAFPEGQEHPVVVTLDHNGTQLPLRNFFGGFSRGNYDVAWEFIVVCIPADGVAVFEVTDEAKTVRVDLVERKPVDDEAWQLNEGFRERRVVEFDPPDAVHEKEFTAQPQGYEPETGLFRIGFQPSNAFLAPWNPVHQWAPSGSMWLSIPMNAKVEFEGIPAAIELNLPNSFQYTGQSGDVAELVTPHVVTTDEVRRKQSDVIPTFKVTGNDEQASLTFQAQGEIRVDFQEVQGVTGHFADGGKPIKFKLGFAAGPNRFEG